MEILIYLFTQNALENALYLTFFIVLMASSWNNRAKRQGCETAYIIAIVPIAAPAAKTTTNVSSSGVPRLLLVCVVVFMVA